MAAINGSAMAHPFPGSFNDPSKHQQVAFWFFFHSNKVPFQIYQYLEALKKDELGWRKSADNIITNNIR